MANAEAAADEWLARAEQELGARNLACAADAISQAEVAGAHPSRCDSLRWMVAMLQGNLGAAWLLSDAIRLRGEPDPHRFWNGEELRGARVIVRCLHGLGDAVQMLRYAPRLARLAADVVYEVPPRMLELAPCFRGVDHAVTWGDQAPAKPTSFDVQVEVMELAYVFRTTADGLPVATDYLDLPAALLAETAGAMGARTLPRVGLVWAAGEWNHARSIPPASLGPLLECPRYEFWNLQGGEARMQLRGLKDATMLCGEGVLALAATIANLDLVITVDTLAAHLAGALGRPCFLLLQHAADWRWQVNRADSPWYPSVRLFRQPSPGDWPGVIAQVTRALEQEAHV